MVTTDKLLFGAAYYPEYMPYERMDTDFSLMRDAGMNVIRIGESTWSTWEPEDGAFDFSLLVRTIEKASDYGLQVIIGTPTYAPPSWLCDKCPDILAVTKDGRCLYGHRQLSDITSPDYLRYSERIIRKMMEVCREHDNIIGYQLDNETRSGDGMSETNQARFVARMKGKYNGDISSFNHEFGLAYWSNSISSWDCFPDLRGTVNGSLRAAYKAYLRDLVTEFLAWQAKIVREYTRPGQFITHNFDFSWKEYSFGIQPLVNQKDAAAALDVAGCDIYHLSQNDSDGAMIAFGGSVARSLKKENYYVLETQAQGRTGWTPFPGQLRLDAYSHLSSGADMLEYWGWHSIHNSFESYWKGMLSHDLLPNDTYKELSDWHHEFAGAESHLTGLKKICNAAILADNRSLTGIDEFPLDDSDTASPDYNTILRSFHDASYRRNIETDIVYSDDDWAGYGMLIVPALYSADKTVIKRLRDYVQNGGHLVMSFRSLMSDSELKIFSEPLPCGLTDVFGMTYDRFTVPDDSCFITLSGEKERCISYIELLRPDDCDVIASYDEPAWNRYTCITTKCFGKGRATYIGANLEPEALENVLEQCAAASGIRPSHYRFPIITKTGVNRLGRIITYVFNYSSESREYTVSCECSSLINGNVTVRQGDIIKIEPWNLVILEQNGLNNPKDG